jgi:hypothetical protein
MVIIQIMGEIIQVMIKEVMINQRKKKDHQECHKFQIYRFHKIIIIILLKINKKTHQRITPRNKTIIILK